MTMDLRESLNAISDVIVNRPPPIRVFDQIYMKAADMLLQAEHVSKWLRDRNVLFIGDGDALALCLVHLRAQGQLADGPTHIHVLDFDERQVNSIKRFAERLGYSDLISSSLYNVIDPLPNEHIQNYDGFYTNPPFGGANDGASVKAFFRRGLEALKMGGICCAVLGDDQTLPWCNTVLSVAQTMLLENGCIVVEMIPEMHSYHLDDNPNLRSCSLIARRIAGCNASHSVSLSDDVRRNFYGRGAELRVRYVRDLSNGGKHESRDYKLIPLEDRG